jgi:phenylalanyl-tRNA synthetase alpha chain
MVTIEFHETLSHVLTQEGAHIAIEGSHEARVWGALPMKGEGAPVTPQGLQEALGKESASVGQGRAFKAKWIGKEGDGFVKLVRLHIRIREGGFVQLFTLAVLLKGRFD